MALHQEWTFHPSKFQVNRPSTFRVMDGGLRGLHLGISSKSRGLSLQEGFAIWQFIDLLRFLGRLTLWGERFCKRSL